MGKVVLRKSIFLCESSPYLLFSIPPTLKRAIPNGASTREYLKFLNEPARSPIKPFAPANPVTKE